MSNIVVWWKTKVKAKSFSHKINVYWKNKSKEKSVDKIISVWWSDKGKVKAEKKINVYWLKTTKEKVTDKQITIWWKDNSKEKPTDKIINVWWDETDKILELDGEITEPAENHNADRILVQLRQNPSYVVSYTARSLSGFESSGEKWTIRIKLPYADFKELYDFDRHDYKASNLDEIYPAIREYIKLYATYFRLRQVISDWQIRPTRIGEKTIYTSETWHRMIGNKEIMKSSKYERGVYWTSIGDWDSGILYGEPKHGRRRSLDVMTDYANNAYQMLRTLSKLDFSDEVNNLKTAADIKKNIGFLISGWSWETYINDTDTHERWCTMDVTLIPYIRSTITKHVVPTVDIPAQIAAHITDWFYWLMNNRRGRGTRARRVR